MKKEKIYQILFIVLTFLTILSVVSLKPVNDLDELWNYNFARNISRGLIPYKDFNMLQMPLLSIIGGLILKLTFDELIIMRIIAALLGSGILYMIYKVFNILNIKKEISIALTFIIEVILIDLFCIDYNFASLLIVLIIIYNEIKNYNKNQTLINADYKKDIFLGVLAGLSITLKQSTGLLICAAVLGNKILFVRNKEDFKIYFKTFIYRLIGIIIPIILLITYLTSNNAMTEFINYAIKGVSEFSNYISYKNLIKFNFIGILSILVPLTLVYTGIKSIIFDKDKKLYIFFVYGLAMFAVCFPISDKIHFSIGAVPTLIIILYELYYWLIKKFKRNTQKDAVIDINTLLVSSTILTLFICSGSNLVQYVTSNDSYSKLNHFKFITIDANLEKQIENVDNYIKSNDNVKILDATAAIYMIPLDRYNKDYDMLLKGNIGFNGEEKIIEEISNSKNTKYLILKDEFNKNWQTPLDIIEYVKENKTKVAEIERFDIYE